MIVMMSTYEHKNNKLFSCESETFQHKLPPAFTSLGLVNCHVNIYEDVLHAVTRNTISR